MTHAYIEGMTDWPINRNPYDEEKYPKQHADYEQGFREATDSLNGREDD